MKTFSILLILAGMVLAPAYWIYAKFYTGSEAILLNLTRQADTASGGAVWAAPPFRLEGNMAPVGLVLAAQGHFSPNMDESRPPRDSYAAQLGRDGAAAQPLGFSLGVKHVSDSNPAFREHLLLMQKVTPGDYVFSITGKAPPEIALDREQLQIGQYVHETDARVVTGGIVLFILGVMALVMI